MKPAAPSDRTRIRRVAENARYDGTTLHAIIDAAHLCHLAFNDDRGLHSIPMACWRMGEHLYIHGSNGGRLMKQLAGGAAVCISICHLDGLVLARSAFNHSMNYRSAVIYGRFEKVEGDADKRAALAAFMDKIAPGRQAEIRPGNDKEFAATTVLRIALDEAVSKVRSGPVVDDEADLSLPVWAGVLPLTQQRGTPQPDTACAEPLPAYLRDWAA
ncbi:pyridoxamine 5'-phosphate oxidase family protein [Paucibacter soli]|uniref:pyridoxamine 5'-phosphate oxidase family protein n=1 Tax=Paucibacter soli TaxID=3133433 RepID=UPI00309BEB88